MKLICEKYQKTFEADEAVCDRLEEYCKFRKSCIVNFMTRELLRDKLRKSESEKGGRSRGSETASMDKLDFAKGDGLLPAIVQDHLTGEVLMLAYINEKSWRRTMETGKAHYWSRSRNQLWLKGETSGHVQLVREILVDCDQDTVVFKVEQLGGAACHKGYASCFFRKVEDGRFVVQGRPVFDPQEVYRK